MPVDFSDAAKSKLDSIISQYPSSQAACLPALHLAQGEFGHLSDDVIKAVAEYLKIPYAHVFGVATFYTMFHRHKVGKNVLMVCTNVSCMLRGAQEILRHIEERLGVRVGETTADGAFTLVEEECLAACANAPMMICGTDYHLELTKEKVDSVLAELRENPKSEHIS